uniref:t-SNARE coiled-coil homology domain-containing protein n=1 Tax=Quercus lobata TaxID=97700 RepID=A0A7N2MBS2_QUELO
MRHFFVALTYGDATQPAREQGHRVTNAVDHVKSGTDALQAAKTLQRKSRKCMMFAIILLLVIAIIIVLSILKPWNKGK